MTSRMIFRCDLESDLDVTLAMTLNLGSDLELLHPNEVLSM